MKKRISLIILTILSLIFTGEGFLFAQSVTNPTDNFKWWKYCQNPLPDNVNYTIWHDFSLVFWSALAVMGVLFIAATAIGLFRAKSDKSNTKVNLFFLFLVIVISLISGYSGFTKFGTEPIEFFYNALRPQESLNSISILWTGIYAPLARLFSVSEVIIYVPSRIFAVLNIVLVYQLSLLLSRNARQSLIAALIFSMSLTNLRFFATDVPIQQALSLFLLCTTAIAAETTLKKPLFAIFSLIFSILAVMLLPVLAIPLIATSSLFVFTQQSRKVRSTRMLATIAAISVGIFFFYKINTVFKLPIAFHLLPDLTNISILFASLVICGLYFSIKEKGYESFVLFISALFTLFILPILPQIFIKSGAWLLLSIAILSPIAASGVYNVALWTKNRQVVVIILLLSLLLLPDYFIKNNDIKNYEIKRYEFLKNTIKQIGQDKSVLYRNNKRSTRLFPFPDFIPGYKNSPCIRPREAIATDPLSHGQRWIYFGPECKMEESSDPPKPDTCEFYKALYKPMDCITTSIFLPDNSGKKVAEEKHEFCKVSSEQ